MTSQASVSAARVVGRAPPPFSDDALALGFAGQHAGRLRYVDAWGRWLHWDGVCWRFDETLVAVNLARSVCRDEAAMCNEPRVAKALASGATVAAVERLARADRRLAATTDQWDADPWALNTPGGIVDLRTGEMRRSLAGTGLARGSCGRTSSSSRRPSSS